MKVFKHRNLMSLIYSVLLALPLCSILGRVLYTQWNKNAKDSYSGMNENTVEYTEITQRSNLITGDEYLFTNGNITSSIPNTGSNFRLYFNVLDVKNYSGNYNLYSAKSVGFYSANATTLYYYFYDENNNMLNGNPLTNNNNFEITIEYLSNNLLSDDILSLSHFLYSIEYNGYYKLDNAFSYSVSQIINNNNFGEINFVGLFSDLFLDQTNSVNALYLNFTNWYMNYALFISVVYILFLVLMWFIQFIRKLLEKGMSFGDRGW